MLYIILAIISELGFMCVTILNKRLRNKGIETVSLLALGIFALPIWMSILTYSTWESAEIIISPMYLG